MNLSFIIWNGSPELLSMGTVTLRWYGLLFALGFLISQQLLIHIYRKEGKDEKEVDTLTIAMVIATILGALWAADAWGGYWSWDPKETWALIVWLNYAAWLHMRLMKGLRGQVAAWWSVIGLLVTTFAFLGVNMFLSGLHSYGEL